MGDFGNPRLSSPTQAQRYHNEMAAIVTGAITTGSQKLLTLSNISMALSGTKPYDPVQRWKDQAPRLEPWNPLRSK